MAARLGGPLLLRLLVVATSAAAASRDGHKEDIHIAGFFPMTASHSGLNSDGSDPGELGRGVMHAVELAVKHVNKARDVLPNVKLHVTWNNTQVGGPGGPVAASRAGAAPVGRWGLDRGCRRGVVGVRVCVCR